MRTCASCNATTFTSAAISPDGVGLGEYTTVYDTFLQQSYAFMLEWVLGTGEEGGQPLPPFKDFVTVNPIDIGV